MSNAAESKTQPATEAPEGWNIYQYEDAKDPDGHPGRGWYFAPEDSPFESAFSGAYPSQEATIAACIRYLDADIPQSAGREWHRKQLLASIKRSRA